MTNQLSLSVGFGRAIFQIMNEIYLQIQLILYWLIEGYTLVITYLLEREFQEYVTCRMSRDAGCDLYFRYWIWNNSQYNYK